MVISDATRELVDGFFDLEPLGEQELQGRHAAGRRVPRPALHRRGRQARRRRPRTLRPMVGRDAELARLQGAWRRATEGLGGDRAHARRGGDREEPAHPRADRAGRRRAGLAVLGPPPQHVAVPGRPRARAHVRRPRAARTRAPVAAGLDPDETVPLLSGLLAGKGEDRPGRSPLASRTATLRALERCWSPIPRGSRCCSWSRTSTGPTRRRSSCSAGSRRGCASSPSCAWRPTGASSSRRGRAGCASSSAPLSPADVRAMAGPTPTSRPPTACRCSSRSC